MRTGLLALGVLAGTLLGGALRQAPASRQDWPV
jgi:hypothetical protein